MSSSACFPRRESLPYPETPWLVSQEVFGRLQSSSGSPYRTSEITPQDPEWTFIHQYFQASPPINRMIKRVVCIHNPELARLFEAGIPGIEQESKGAAFQPKWREEDNAAQREKVMARYREMTAAYSPFAIKWQNQRKDTFQNTKILPLWQGSTAQICDSICQVGFKFFGKHQLIHGEGSAGPSTDVGFFGSGIYFTNSARYAADIYSDGNMLLAWVSMREPYPVVADRPHPHKPKDMQKLEGLGAYENYNAHYIPVVSVNPGDETCAVYYPCTEGQQPAWDEIAVFEKSQALARFWIELQVALVRSPSQKAATFGELLDKILNLLDNPEVQQDVALSSLLTGKTEFLFTVADTAPLDAENLAFYGKIKRLIGDTGKVRAVVAKQLGPSSPQKAADVSPPKPTPKTAPPVAVMIPQSPIIPRPAIAFGAAEWTKYFGDVGIEPPITQEIVETLKSPCPYWGGKKVEDTHMLILIPQTINGRPFNLNLLQDLIKRPQGSGHPTKYQYYYEGAQKEIGNQPPPSSYWVLITKDVLPNSRNKTYSEQQALIKGPYTVPGALEIATGILMHHVQTGEKLYPDSLNIYTRCQERLSNGYRVVVGSFGSSGLCLYDDCGDGHRCVNGGLGGVRKF